RPGDYMKYEVGMATQDHVGNFLKTGEYDNAWTLTDAGYAKLDFSRGRAKDDANVEYAYDGFILQVARSFCEVDFDGQGGNWFANPPEPTEDWEAKWTSAVTSIKNFLKAAAANRRVRYQTPGGAYQTVEIDVDQLFDSTLTFSDCYAMLPLKMPGVYNAAVPNNKKVPLDANGWYFVNDKAKEAFDSWLGVKVIRPFMSYLANRGFTPGFSIVQIPKSSAWHMCLMGDASIGMGFRCCVLILGMDEYPTTTRQSKDGTGKLVLKRLKNTAATLSDYSYSSLALHELGHCLFHLHAPPNPSDTPDSRKIHDTTGDGYCVMTYLPCEGDFCGRCALTLRGWKDIRNIPTP
ncbi:MAG: hypothetical protein JXB13_05925, partial [Phycisphaerae bacterium]|nr:hypothetical protein [Phycisphaerae bacterium]